MRYYLKKRARSSAFFQHVGTRSPRCRARRNLRWAATQLAKLSLLACHCLGAGGPDWSCGADPIGNRVSTGRNLSLCRYACRHPIEICAGRVLNSIRSREGEIFKHENSKFSAGSSDPMWEHVPFGDAMPADLNWMDGVQTLGIAWTVVRQRGK